MTCKNGCSRQDCQPSETFVAPKPGVRTKLRPKNGEEQDQRGLLKSRDIRQVHSKRRLEVSCENRDSLKEDMCSCLACPKTLPRSLTIQEETRRCHSYVIRMISRTRKATHPATECRTRFFVIEQRCASCFPTFARLEGRIKSTSPSFLDQERFRHSTSGISRFGQTVCQHRQSVDPVNTRIGDSALFIDSTCFFTCARASQSKLW